MGKGACYFGNITVRDGEHTNYSGATIRTGRVPIFAPVASSSAIGVIFVPAPGDIDKAQGVRDRLDKFASVNHAIEILGFFIVHKCVVLSWFCHKKFINFMNLNQWFISIKRHYY